MRDIAQDLIDNSMGFDSLIQSEDSYRSSIADDFSYLQDISDEEYQKIIEDTYKINDYDEYDNLVKKLNAIIKSIAPAVFKEHNAKDGNSKEQVPPKETKPKEPVPPKEPKPKEPVPPKEKKPKAPKEKTLADKLSDIRKANKNIPEELFNKIVVSFGIIDSASDETLNELQASVQSLNAKIDTIPTKPVGKNKVKESLNGLAGIERGTYNEIPLSNYVDTILSDITKSIEEAKAAKQEQQEREKAAKKEQQDREKAAKKEQQDREKAAQKEQQDREKADKAAAKVNGINALVQSTIAKVEQLYPQTKDLYSKWLLDSDIAHKVSEKSATTLLAKSLRLFETLEQKIKNAYESKLKGKVEFNDVVNQIINQISHQDISALKNFNDNCIAALNSIVATANPKVEPGSPKEEPKSPKEELKPISGSEPKPTDDIDDILSHEEDMYAVSEEDDDPFKVASPDEPEPITFSPSIEQRLQSIFTAIDMNASFTEESKEAKQYVRELLANPSTDETTKNNIINFNGRNTELLKSIFDHVNHTDEPTSFEPPAPDTSSHTEATLDNPDEATTAELETPLYPPDSTITEYTGLWDRAIITEFGYPFINFSNPIINGILKNDDDAKAEFKMQLRNAKLNTNRLAGKLWDYLFSTPIKLMSALYHSRYTSKKLNYIRVSADEMFSNSEYVHINPIKIDNKEADFYDTQLLSRIFINQFYSYISVDDVKIYAKYNEIDEAEYVALRRENQRPEYYIMMPKKSPAATFRVSETTTAEGFGGTLLSLLSLRDKSVLVRAKINKRDGGFVMPQKLTDSLFTKFI